MGFTLRDVLSIEPKWYSPLRVKALTVVRNRGSLTARRPYRKIPGRCITYRTLLLELYSATIETRQRSCFEIEILLSFPTPTLPPARRVTSIVVRRLVFLVLMVYLSRWKSFVLTALLLLPSLKEGMPTAQGVLWMADAVLGGLSQKDYFDYEP